MKFDLSKDEVAALCKTMSEYCRHQPDPMIASEALRPLRIKLESQGVEEKKAEEAKEAGNV